MHGTRLALKGSQPGNVNTGTEMNETTLDELDSATDATLASSIGLGNEVNLDVILDVPVTMAMEVGRTRISIRPAQNWWSATSNRSPREPHLPPTSARRAG